MAGSYNHCVDDDGRLLSNLDLVGMLENGGDVYEAVEEMYGMIWYLAGVISDQVREAPAQIVEIAREDYQVGLARSPGVRED